MKELFFFVGLVLCVLALPLVARPAEEDLPPDDRWGIDFGLGGTFTSSEYKGVESLGSALPLVGYEGKWLYLRGLSGGLHIFKNEYHEINVQASYLPQSFYAGWSDDSRMKRLDDRWSSVTAGLNYRLTTAYGVGSVSIAGDVLGYSNGIIAEASYAYPIRLEMLTITPMLGVQWTDTNYNNYYYGVSFGESRLSGVRAYEPESAFSPNGGLTARLLLSENWSVFVNGKATLLGAEIQDSPIVEDNIKYSLSGGFLYSF